MRPLRGLPRPANAGVRIYHYANPGEDIFHIFGEHPTRSRPLYPPPFRTLTVRHYRERHEGNIGQLMRDFGERPRHVVIRCHYDQRAETSAFGPALSLDSVSQRIQRAVEIDA